jgi:large subunit ribosomal protein L35
VVEAAVFHWEFPWGTDPSRATVPEKGGLNFPFRPPASGRTSSLGKRVFSFFSLDIWVFVGIFAALMPKPIARSKTKKSVAKRFKVTGTGKVLRGQSSRRHLLSSKSAKRKRQLAKTALVDDTDLKRIRLALPFSH